ncbi:uncharacterized protein FYW61_003620 [Anableps anableps]
MEDGSEPWKMVKIEAEEISQYENQDGLMQETDPLILVVSGSPGIKEEPEELDFKEVEVASVSEPQQVVKKETDDTSQDGNKDVRTQEINASMVTVSGNPAIKEDLKQVKVDSGTVELQQMIKKEMEGTSQDESQDVLNQETCAVVVTVSGSPKIKEEPEELDNGSEPQRVVKKETDDSGQDENQDVLKQEINAWMVTATREDHGEPEPHRTNILHQDLLITENCQEMHHDGASGSSRDEPLEAENVDEALAHKKSIKGKKCLLQVSNRPPSATHPLRNRLRYRQLQSQKWGSETPGGHGQVSARGQNQTSDPA